jgi:hypothetical protein
VKRGRSRAGCAAGAVAALLPLALFGVAACSGPRKTVLDLAVAVALGGDCLADAGVLRAEPALFGPDASDPVISRLTGRLALTRRPR